MLAPRFDGGEEPLEERIEDISVQRFDLHRGEGGASAWLREYSAAMWRIWRTIRRLSEGARFDVIHAANPPDFLLLAALGQRRRGSALVFDQHDLMPEMADERFGSGARPVKLVLRFSERLAHRVSDISIVTNESFRRIALARGHRAPEDVIVVRNGPQLDRFTAVEPDPALLRGRAHLIVYEGVMGPLDGVDHAIRALADLREHRDDWHALFLGDGEALPDLRQLTSELGLEDHVEFGGFVDHPTLRRAICSASVCLAPDPHNALTDVSTLIKIVDYMALGRPTVSYDLKESRATAGDSAVYATRNDPKEFARLIDELLEDPDRRERMGRDGRARFERELAWEYSERALLAAYERAAEKARARDGATN